MSLPGRIIPARAGFTGRRSARASGCTDHPRSRGVYLLSPRSGVFPTGSSPLARGLQPGEQQVRVADRIIPARAGFTGFGSWFSPPRLDHPRSRGVYCGGAHLRGPPAGSSPLARGLRQRAGGGRRRPGIIPARAGFTPGGQSRSDRGRDHPRSRGVYTCGSLESQRTRTLPDPRRLHCRPRARSAELR